MTGRTRHSLVETRGTLVTVIVHSASSAERDGADWLLVSLAFLGS